VTNKERLESALEQFKPHQGQETVRRLADYVSAKIECLRDTLEREESALMRGKLQGLRELEKILND